LREATCLCGEAGRFTAGRRGCLSDVLAGDVNGDGAAAFTLGLGPLGELCPAAIWP